jgi:P4 family phage/plasmid primase-like protien
MLSVHELIENLADHLESTHSFLYTNEQLYEKRDGVWSIVEDHQIDNYISSLAPKFGLKPRMITPSHKKNIIDSIKSSNFLPSAETESRIYPNLIAFANGYIDINDIKKGKVELQPFPINDGPGIPLFFNKLPHDFNTQIPIDSSSSALKIFRDYAPTISKLISEARNSEEEVLLQLQKIGYILYRSNPYKVLFVEHGEQDTGKTTFLNLVASLIGKDNMSNISMQELANNQFSLSNLYGKLANIYDDMGTNIVYGLGILKMLSGNSPISANRKYKQSPITFHGTIKMIFATNFFPKLSTLSDKAFFSRIIVTKYTRTFRRDDRIRDSMLLNEAEIQATLVASVLALRELLAAGGFSSESYSFVEEWKRQTDHIYRFIQDMLESGELVRDSQGWITKDAMYRMYQLYMEDSDTDEEVLKKNTLTSKLATYGISADRRGVKQEGIYRGIRERNENETKPPSQRHIVDSTPNSAQPEAKEEAEPSPPPSKSKADAVPDRPDLIPAASADKAKPLAQPRQGSPNFQGENPPGIESRNPAQAQNPGKGHGICDRCGKSAPLYYYPYSDPVSLACVDCMNLAQHREED